MKIYEDTYMMPHEGPHLKKMNTLYEDTVVKDLIIKKIYENI